MREKEIECSVARIVRMEKLFELVNVALHGGKDEPCSASVKEAVRELSDYYESGEWLCDYEFDEQRLLPPELKRGVLSQDGLYDLLSAIKEKSALNPCVEEM